MLVVTGAVAFDNILNFPGKFSDHILPEKLHVINISCVVDTLDRRFGGPGGNQSYTLALLGQNPTLLASAGNDIDPYKKYLDHAGVDTRFLVSQPDMLTAAGFVLTDKNDNQIWGFAKNAMKEATNLHIQTIGPSVDFVLITPDDYTAVEQYVTESITLNIPFAFDPAFDIPQLKLDILKQGADKAAILFGNDYEIAQLEKRIGITHKQVVKNKIVITTLAQKGSIVERSDQRVEIAAIKPKQFVDPVGAGDAYRSGFMAGYMKKFALKTCGQMGTLAATYAIEHKGAINHQFTKDEFCKRYKESFGEEITL